MLRHGPGGMLLGLAFGLVLVELLTVRSRLRRLEGQAFQVEPQETPEEDAEVRFEPVPDERPEQAENTVQPVGAIAFKAKPSAPDAAHGDAGPQAVPESSIDRLFGKLEEGAGSVFAKITEFFTGGNLVLRVGLIILFIGVSFLIKYAAQHNLMPLELRLAGAALGGLVLLGIGWRLRLSNGGYGLALQGGGVGILYLVVFGAGKLYGLVPPVMALALMVALVAFSCLLAVLQDSRSLAVFGSIGGFLAPVLMSSGGGSHVLLFSYFALLNTGIVGIAWFKAWRELNLIGFLFTFGIGTLWGSSGYTPAHFATTEPFLLLFFAFYVTISILFALRQPVNLRGFIDGPLVFGLPLVVSALQYFLVKDFTLGMAFSALGLGAFYLCCATILWKRVAEPLRLLCETFLALGVVFTSLTIPLGLDGRWSGAIWALEGAGMVWVGARQSRVLARHFGLLLQVGAGLIFLSSVLYPLDSLLFANQYFLGCLFLALGALISSYVLDRYRENILGFERYYALPLMVLGLIWWYIGGIQEIDKQFAPQEAASCFLYYLSVTSILCGFTAERLQWARFRLSLLLQLPGMVLGLLFTLFELYYQPYFLQGWGLGAWLISIFVLYRILFIFTDDWSRKTGGWYHAVALWMLFFLVAHDAAKAVEQVQFLGNAWSYAVWGVVPAAMIAIVLRWSRTGLWPAGKDPDTYLGAGAGGLALSMIFWLLLSFTQAGNSRPLPYLPVLNPLELTGLVGMLVLLLRARSNQGRWSGWRASLVAVCFPLVGGLFFIWLNVVVARTVHFFAGVPYYLDAMYGSTLFQAAIAALWGVGALAITVWATRNRSRKIWTIGALLLGLTVVKLFIVDLSGSGTVARIVSFLVVGILMLIIGYFSPIPPKPEEKS